MTRTGGWCMDVFFLDSRLDINIYKQRFVVVNKHGFSLQLNATQLQSANLIMLFLSPY